MNKEIKGEDFRKMQLTELDMLVEFDKVCRKYNINYVLFGGSLLGAVRHRGYIPWDDDADIGMLREDYETFKKHKDEMNPNICFFQDHDTDHEYRWEYGKLRRTGSTYVRVGQEHLKCKTGIFVDVFPMDDIPLSIVGQMFQDAKKKNLKVYAIGDIQKCADRFVDCSPFEVLAYFRNAEEVITDTFHGSIFSVITHRPFTTLIRKSVGNSYGNEEKLSDLLKRLGLANRMTTKIEDTENINEKAIDYAKVDEQLKAHREVAKEYLRKNLEE